MVWLKQFGPAQNILGPVKGQGISMTQKMWTNPKYFVEGQGINAVKFLGWLKKFGPAQNILGPVKGQGIRGSPS